MIVAFVLVIVLTKMSGALPVVVAGFKHALARGHSQVLQMWPAPEGGVPVVRRSSRRSARS